MSMAESFKKLNEMDMSDIDLDISKAGSWPIAVKLITWLIIASIVIGAGYYFIIKDQIITLETKQRQEQQLRQQFTTKAREAANLEAYKRQLAEMQQRFGKLVSQLPSKTQIPGLLDDVAEKVNESGLALKRMETQNEVQQNFYIELPVALETAGNYHDFGSFVSGIAALPRIVTLHDFEITRGTSGDDLSMSITARTYRYKDQDQNEQ